MSEDPTVAPPLSPYQGTLEQALRDRTALLLERVAVLRSIGEVEGKIVALDGVIRGIRAMQGIPTAPVNTIASWLEAPKNISQAAYRVIALAGRPMRVAEVVPGIEAQGFSFKAQAPIDSLRSILHQLAAKGHLQAMGEGFFQLGGLPPEPLKDGPGTADPTKEPSP